MGFRAIIDPGHAPGNVNRGQNGYYEYQAMWKLANYLKDELEALGFEARLTRAEDEDLPPFERGRLAEGYDIFISEHTNASGSPYSGMSRGVEVFYSLQVPGDRELAANISKAVSEMMGNPDRGAKTRPYPDDETTDYYGVIRGARSVGCPHVLLSESGFHDNLEDEAFLLDDGNLTKIAKVHAQIINDFLKESE